MNNLKRTRLKLTVVIVIALIGLLYVPIDVIYAAVEKEKFDLINPWAAFIAVISTIGLVGGYYINKETERSSLLSNVFNFSSEKELEGKKIMKGEDESDPQNDLPI